jgi:hypothetical protein
MCSLSSQILCRGSEGGGSSNSFPPLSSDEFVIVDAVTDVDPTGTDTDGGWACVILEVFCRSHDNDNEFALVCELRLRNHTQAVLTNYALNYVKFGVWKQEGVRSWT